MSQSISFESRIGTLPLPERAMLEGLSPVSDERWNLRLNNAAFHVIARDGERPVGFGFAENPWGAAGDSWSRYVPNALEFGGLIVDPEYRRMGIMTELVRLRLGMARALGRQPVCVTLADNHNVIGYYSSRGWTPRKQFCRDGIYLIPWVLETPEQREQVV